MIRDQESTLINIPITLQGYMELLKTTTTLLTMHERVSLYAMRVQISTLSTPLRLHHHRQLVFGGPPKLVR